MPNVVFNNKVIEAKAKDLLTTSVNTRSLMSVDYDLTQNAGMVKTVNTYTYTGAAEALSVGAGNTTRGSIAYSGVDYTVQMVQQAFDYYDEDYLKDNTIVDNMVKGATQVMANKMTADFVAECAKASLAHTATNGLIYDEIVDAIGVMNVEDESGLFLLVNNEGKAELRKDDDYKAAHMGDVVYNGQVGTVCGIPVVCSKAIPANTAYLMTKEAVKLFMKKDVETEQNRVADTRKNEVYLRACYVCALADATKIVKITY